MATCPYITGILSRHSIPSTLIKVNEKVEAKLCELSQNNKTHLKNIKYLK